MSDSAKQNLAAGLATIVLTGVPWLFYSQVIVPEQCYKQMYWDLRRQYDFTPKTENVLRTEDMDALFSDARRGPRVEGIPSGKLRRR